MQVAPYLRPTALQRLRAFVAPHDPIPAWSSSDEVVDRLLLLLVDRRHDPEFWLQLEALVLALQYDVRAGLAHGLPAREAEILSEAEISAIVLEIQTALEGAGGQRGAGAMSGVLAGRSVGVVAFITLLGAAISLGCAKNSPGEPAKGSDSTVIAPEQANSHSQQPSTDAGADSLAEIFRDGSPEHIAAKLEAIVDASVDSPDARTAAPRASATGTSHPKPEPTIIDPRPVYRGVIV